jgi:hypothetical protein
MGMTADDGGQSRQRKRKSKPLAKQISLLLKRTRRQHARNLDLRYTGELKSLRSLQTNPSGHVPLRSSCTLVICRHRDFAAKVTP